MFTCIPFPVYQKPLKNGHFGAPMYTFYTRGKFIGKCIENIPEYLLMYDCTCSYSHCVLPIIPLRTFLIQFYMFKHLCYICFPYTSDMETPPKLTKSVGMSLTINVVFIHKRETSILRFLTTAAGLQYEPMLIFSVCCFTPDSSKILG